MKNFFYKPVKGINNEGKIINTRYSLITCIIAVMLILLTSGISIALDSATTDITVDDKDIIAIVNGEIISVNDYITMCKIYSADLTDKSQREEILQNLINDKVAVQVAKEKGIIITEADLEKDIDQMVKLNYGGDRKELEKQLISAGFTIDDYKWFKKTELAKTRLQEIYLKVTDTETKKYFNDNRKKLGYMIEASQILLSTNKEALAIIKQLKKGASFSKLAAQKSIEPNAKKTKGYLGWFIKGIMVPEFEKAVFSQKVGKISSKPVKTQFGYHVIKVHNKKPAEYVKIKANIKSIISQKKYQDFTNMLTKRISDATIEKRVENIPLTLS